MENAVIFYGHLEYFTDIRYIIWPFGNLVVIWNISPCFGTQCVKKNLATLAPNSFLFCTPRNRWKLSPRKSVGVKGKERQKYFFELNQLLGCRQSIRVCCIRVFTNYNYKFLSSYIYLHMYINI
jgi:hypothetical protein